MRYYLAIVVCVSTLSACEYFSQGSQQTPLARVYESYLYADDVKDLIPEGTPSEDSASIVNNYINRWASQQLLLNKANINLTQEQISAYNRLVEDYKNDLFSDAYLGAIVAQQLDSTITEAQYKAYYETAQSNFNLKETLLKVRFIHLAPKYADIVETKKKFSRFSKEDKQDLEAASLQFKNANLNDSVWVKKDALLRQLPVLKDVNENLLKKGVFSELEDSLGVYLLKIEDALQPNETAPLSYIKPTIEQIILSKRKLDLIKKNEKDIIKDAIKNKNFEIYTPQ